MNERRPRGKLTRRLSQAMIVTLVVTIAALLVAGPGHRFGLLDLGTAFVALAVSAFGAVVLAVGGFWAAASNVRRGTGGMLAATALAGVIGLALTVNNLIWYQRADQSPPIHDITTDVRDPPEFLAVLPLREDAPNAPEYAGDEAAFRQMLAYPDIDTLSIPLDGDEVFAAALETADDMGWRIVSAEQGAGRIEAVDTTAFFGFQDDIVVRVRARDGATDVDVRSKSRVGASDLGTNARRIRAFNEELRSRLSI
jgi:hypothetical protein